MRVLIAIHGAHSQPERMQAQRETWLKDLKGADYRYFLGLVDDLTEWDSTDVVYINSPDGPVWQGPHRTWVLNRKTEALVRYALTRGYDYVFKCDDDTWVHVDRLLDSGFEEHDYAGSMDRHYDFALGRSYEWAQGGAGYWLSRRAMEVVAANGLHRARAEDFAVGQLLAANGIRPHHDGRYRPAVSESDLEDTTSWLPSPRNSRLITLHKVSPPWMHRLHER